MTNYFSLCSRAAATACALGVSLSVPGGLTAAIGQERPQLVTQEQVEEVLGVGVRVETRGADGYAYISTDPAGGVTIDMTPADMVSLLKGDTETLEGLGDDAFFQASSSRMAILVARKGTKAITLTVQFPLGAPDKVTDVAETARALAALALDGL